MLKKDKIKLLHNERGFPYWGDGRESPHQLKIYSFPPPGKIPPPTKFLFTPPRVHSLPPPPPFPLNKNFLNSQNHSSSDSHHPIKRFPQQKFTIPLNWEKRIFPLPLKAIWKTLPTKFSVLQPKFHLQPKKFPCSLKKQKISSLL